jgi:hypothetical protein
MNALIMSILVLDVGIQAVIINNIFRAYQRNKQNDEIEEEENLARYESYSPSEQQKGWEFKILRTNTGGFRNRKTLRQVCIEEARSGWILLEKLDDQRLRFRRPLAARERDHLSKLDPYRTYYGVPAIVETLVTVGVLLMIMGGTAYWGFNKMQGFFSNLQTKPIQSAPTPLPSKEPQPSSAKPKPSSTLPANPKPVSEIAPRPSTAPAPTLSPN